jgi:hypothetical protein
MKEITETSNKNELNHLRYKLRKEKKIIKMHINGNFGSFPATRLKTAEKVSTKGANENS